MTDEDAMLEAIRAAPDDDVPRLIFADWLEEGGDARSEFIRLQCERARTSRAFDRYEELEREERAWLARHKEDWLGPLRGKVYGWEAQRGFITQILIDTRTFLDHVDVVARVAPLLRRLELRGARDLLFQLTTCSFLARVSSLDLARNQITGEGVRLFAACPFLDNLEELDLTENPISANGAIHIAESPHFCHLRRLNLGGSGLVGQIGPAGAEALAASSYLAGLATLDLHYQMIGDEGTRALALSRHIQSLTALDLRGNGITEGGIGDLAISPNFTFLTHLYLAGNQIGNGAIFALADSVTLRRVRVLDIGATFADPGALGVLRARFGNRVT